MLAVAVVVAREAHAAAVVWLRTCVCLCSPFRVFLLNPLFPSLLLRTYPPIRPARLQVRDFQSVIGRETAVQCRERWGGKPDIVLACVGGGSNAMGIFHEFVEDPDVRLIGVEAGGEGVSTTKHAATLTMGSPGVLHGSYSYLLQDNEGQVIDPHSISAGCVLV